MNDQPTDVSKPPARGLRAIGPAIIVASVVLGPGSILTSSKVGHEFGYSMAWVLITAGLMMFGMVALSARLGVGTNKTICDELADRLGRPFAAFIGVILFLVVASFQTSNNIAVVTAVDPLLESKPQASSVENVVSESPNSTSANAGEASVVTASNVALVVLNAFIIVALYGFRSLYVPIERLMKFLILVMVVGFAGNVFFAKPSLSALAEGLIPRMPESSDWMPLLGLVATTFSVAGAFYQSYLVREKGWTKDDVGQGTVDSAVGIAVLCGATLLVMMTSAAVLHGTSVELKTATDVGRQLEPLFGQGALVLFSVGLLAAAFSSLMVNAMVGGTVLADSLGLGWSMNDKWPKAFTVAALLLGMGAAIATTSSAENRVRLIVFAQALTVVGSPMLACSLLYLATRPDESGSRRIPGWIILLTILGTIASFGLAGRTLLAVYTRIAG